VAVADVDESLRTLFDAIVARDRATTSRLLGAMPQLARAALASSAAGRPGDHFFDEISHYAYAGDTPLHMAAAAYAADIASDLISRGANVRAKNRRGAQPLHYAADGVPGAPAWNPESQSVVVEFLITVGGEVNAKDASGVAPLHRAVRTRSAAAVRALLAGGADVRVRNKSGSTPLHLAVQDTGRGGSGLPAAREQQAEIIGLLLDRGATVDDRDHTGRSVIDCVRADWIRPLLRST
jgi:hypothetical protein